MTLEARIDAAIASVKDSGTIWQQLIVLFRSDREAFYELACDGLKNGAAPELRELARLASRLRTAVRESYDFDRDANGAWLVAGSGERTPVPDDEVAVIADFMREVDGKTTASAGGKDYEGLAISAAEVRFKLGDASEMEGAAERLRANLYDAPMVLRLSEEELPNLSTQPRYVTFQLLHCARKTVLAPSTVFRGLKRGSGGLPRINNGWAICGRPKWSYDNDGKSVPAPPGMIFVVYTDEDGFVFDWDWVNANSDEPGCPLNPELRFEGPQQTRREFALELPQHLAPGTFDPTIACYSSRGDCIFCYVTDRMSFAERINSDLTVFYALGTESVTGFKIKNVQRILAIDKTIVIDDAPPLSVRVRSVLLATLKLHTDASVRIYDMLIEALFKTNPEVRVPKQPSMPVVTV